MFVFYHILISILCVDGLLIDWLVFTISVGEQQLNILSILFLNVVIMKVIHQNL
jgi:hypothetical protein